jgi:hypothetical protein
LADTAPNPAFAAFWQAYPRKQSKADAAAAFAKLGPNPALLEIILAAVERQKKSFDWTKEAGRFIPFPATWLNGRRWEDEPTEVLTPLDGQPAPRPAGGYKSRRDAEADYIASQFATAFPNLQPE